MQILRSWLRRLRAEAHETLGANRRARARLDGSRAAVLCYHRVLPRAEAERLGVEPGMFVTPATFRAQLRWLRERFMPLGLGEIVERIARGAALPEGACALTFDDGWRDNYEHAWPALREAGVPATIFLVAGRVGTRGAFWPDAVWRRLRAVSREERRAAARALLGDGFVGEPEHAVLDHLKRLPEPERERAIERLGAASIRDAERELLDWDEVAEMARGGVDLESHGLTHAILPGLPRERIEAELRGSLTALRERGYAREALFAYPTGAFGPSVAEAARAAGFRAAFTTQRGLVSAREPLLELPRLLLHEDVSATAAEFFMRVPGFGRID
jgi:peptidoglycan/xylan/chitin deacetylase (PgdA/CDA1 family)